VTCPVTIVHGAEDQLIPVGLSRKLFAAAPSQSATGVERRFVELPGVGHNAIPREPIVEAVRRLVVASDK